MHSEYGVFSDSHANKRKTTVELIAFARLVLKLVNPIPRYVPLILVGANCPPTKDLLI
jgi:hypothetical protein